MDVAFRNRLSVHQVKNALIVGIVLGITLSTIQIGVDLVKERKRVDTTVHQVISIMQDSAARSVYTLDESLAEGVVNGLLKYQPIRIALIGDDSDNTLARGQKPISKARFEWLVDLLFEREKQYKVDLFHETIKKPVGHIEVVVDNYFVARGFLDRAGLVIVSGVVRNMILAGILTLIFYYTLTRPLINLISHLSGIDPEKPAQDLLKPPVGHSEDELGLLTRTTNHLLNCFDKNLTKVHQAEEKLKEYSAQLESEVKSLQDILPICCFCKNIRNDEGYYEQIELYIRKHSGVDFSHTICPKCLEDQYPEEYERYLEKKKTEAQ